MATYLGGDITEISCSHPTLGDFRFSTKGDESYEVDFGGFRNDDDDSAITGNGKKIGKKTQTRWSFSGPLMVDMKNKVETNNIPKLAESDEDATWTFTHISGAIWKGEGEIVGELKIDTNTAQMPVKVSGGGKLEEI